jgi:quinol monooxygenase YgiN
VANVVAARWRAKEGCEDRLAPVIAELIPLACLEPGCPFYQANCSIEDPRLFFIYEQHVDEAGYRAHSESEHFAPPAAARRSPARVLHDPLRRPRRARRVIRRRR